MGRREAALPRLEETPTAASASAAAVPLLERQRLTMPRCASSACAQALHFAVSLRAYSVMLQPFWLHRQCP